MDVKQEGLGDCWFLCVASVIAQHPHLLHQIIPSDQCLYGSDYQGILAFRFWNLGRWKTVYIDDTLPVDENGELIYSRCTTSNEFWLPLLEKAFAKFHGSYSVIEGGFSNEAFLVLTGYITEDFISSKLENRQLHELLEMECQHNSLITTGSKDADEEQGIAEYHAYSVTGAYTVRAGDSFVRLVRVRNPWGDVEDSEWTGVFSDKDPKWTEVDAETKKKLEYAKDEDGQFFMKAAHFKKHFPDFTVASRCPNFGNFYGTPAHQDKEKRKMEKLVNKQKYVDKDFPLSSSESSLRWKRPHEIVRKPELFVDGPSHMDIRQHNLGDCWFLAAASVIAQHPHLINQVIPTDQYLYGKFYTGILAFRFWNLGEWTTVYIDDTLAVNEKDELHYGQSTASNEFWLPLLEKAFAKFHGGYENIEGGLSTEAFLILTGYIIEDIVEPKFTELQLYNLFSSEVQHNSLITVGSPTGSYEEGIVGYHVYSVTGVYSLQAGDSVVRLLRLRNPWGDIQDTVEWQGAFSDNDPKWTGVDAETRKKLEYVKDEDGQFFMKVSHFKRHFTHFWMAYKSPNFGDFYETTSQQIYNFSNIWDKGMVVEGEGVEYAENFLRNPQYILTVAEKGEDEVSEYEIDLDEEVVETEEEEATPPPYNVIIQLIQDQNRGKYDTEIYHIGLSVFQTGGRYPKELGPENLEEFEPHKGSVEPVQHGSIIARLQLRPGKYIVIPWVKEAIISRPFLMRVYALQRITMEAVNREE